MNFRISDILIIFSKRDKYKELIILKPHIFSETGEEIQAKQIYTTGIKYFDELEGLANNQIDYDRSSSPLMTPQHQITRRIVQDKYRAIEAQKFYLDLLHRYLSSQVGPQHSVILMRSYCDVLTKLKEMRQILLAKSLPF